MGDRVSHCPFRLQRLLSQRLGVHLCVPGWESESASCSPAHFQIPSDPLKPIRDSRSENKEANWSFG